MNRSDLFRIVLTALLSVLTWIAVGIQSKVEIIDGRLRCVEKNQSAILARLEGQYER